MSLKRKCVCGTDQILTAMESPSGKDKGNWWICKSCGTEESEFELEAGDRQRKKIQFRKPVLKYAQFSTSEDFENWQLNNKVEIVGVYPIAGNNTIENLAGVDTIVSASEAQFHQTTFSPANIFVIYK